LQGSDIGDAENDSLEFEHECSESGEWQEEQEDQECSGEDLELEIALDPGRVFFEMACARFDRWKRRKIRKRIRMELLMARSNLRGIPGSPRPGGGLDTTESWETVRTRWNQNVGERADGSIADVIVL
jgi:hypothetical protein